ncbi:hypothetical protein Tco_1570080, partial [Tanacetum coccineum]
MPNFRQRLTKVSLSLWQHVMQTGMAMTTTLWERVAEGLNASFEN